MVVLIEFAEGGVVKQMLLQTVYKQNGFWDENKNYNWKYGTDNPNIKYFNGNTWPA